MIVFRISSEFAHSCCAGGHMREVPAAVGPVVVHREHELLRVGSSAAPSNDRFMIREPAGCAMSMSYVRPDTAS